MLFFHILALDQVPTANQLDLVQHIDNPPMLSSNPLLSHSTTLPTQPPSEKTPTTLYVGGGMPLIPAKLAKRIQECQFVEMVEFMPDYLRVPNLSDEDQLKSSKVQELGNHQYSGLDIELQLIYSCSLPITTSESCRPFRVL